DQGRRLDALPLLTGEVGFHCPHALQASEDDGPVVDTVRRQAAIGFGGRPVVRIGVDRVPVRSGVAISVGVRPGDDELRHMLRVMEAMSRPMIPPSLKPTTTALSIPS